MDVAVSIAEARRELAAGHDKEAARLLSDAVYRTHDPESERQIRELAAQGRERAGRFGKGRWDEIIRVAELGGARPLGWGGARGAGGGPGAGRGSPASSRSSAPVASGRVGLTILLGVLCAVCWGAPDVWLAQATRSVGPFPTVFGSMAIGLAIAAPAALFIGTPQWTTRGLLLGVALGAGSAFAYYLGFRAFRDGAVSVVAPIIACEGGIAAVLALASGERPGRLVGAFVPVAVVGVVLVAMGRGGGKVTVVPAAAAALIWGGILVLSAPVADDLGVYWGFLLVRAAGVALALPVALASGAWRSWTADPWRVAAWGVGDTAAYLLYFAAADRGPVAVASVLAAQFATVAVIVGLLAGERLLPRQQLGVALVIVAVSGIAIVGG